MVGDLGLSSWMWDGSAGKLLTLWKGTDKINIFHSLNQKVMLAI